MIDGTVTVLTQFGAAGLIGMLWVFERRHAATRDRQLNESHQKLVGQERELDALLTVVKENTRAISTLEQGQRRLIDLLEHLRRSKSADAA